MSPSDNPEPIYVDDSLLGKAEQLSQLRLAKDPDNPALLAALAKIYRKLGKLADATRLYERLNQLDPEDSQFAYTHAILATTEVPLPPPGIRASPFVLLSEFLPPAIHETLVPFVLANQDRMVVATVGQNQYRPEARQSLEIFAEWGQQAVYQCVRDALPKVQARLHVPAFGVGETELKLRVYLDGHFFRIHMDCPARSKQNVNRRISFTYFFHRMPRAFTGGALLLFDTDIENNLYTTSAFTRIEPEDNSIVFFPSACYHSVVPVSCPSQEFANSRFVINGHFSRHAPAATDAPEIEEAARDGSSEAEVAAGNV
jgi:Rps23 Pro-64 3,4-dihydroxylase Tpa1-like proline 4-hydroxylase